MKDNMIKIEYLAFPLIMIFLLFACEKENFDIVSSSFEHEPEVIFVSSECDEDRLEYVVDSLSFDLDSEVIIILGDQCSLGVSGKQFNYIIKDVNLSLDTVEMLSFGLPILGFATDIPVIEGSQLKPMLPNRSFFMNMNTAEIYEYSSAIMTIEEVGSDIGDRILGKISGEINRTVNGIEFVSEFNASFCSQVTEVCM